MEEGKKDVEGWRKRGRKDKVRNEQGNERKHACKRMLILAAKAERKIAGRSGTRMWKRTCEPRRRNSEVYGLQNTTDMIGIGHTYEPLG